MIDPGKAERAFEVMLDNEAELLKLCFAFAAEKGLNEKHRFIVAPVRIEVTNGCIFIHRHADLGLIVGDKATIESPRIIKHRAVTLTTEVK